MHASWNWANHQFKSARRSKQIVNTAMYVAIAIWCAAASPNVGADDNSVNKPNILFILTDDQGYGDVSTYETRDVHTPHIDSIARSGMLFTNMRANCTVCSPSRAALLTGCYPDRVGVPGVIRTKVDDSWGYLDPSVATLADQLKSLGYHTAAIGKWHLGLSSPNLPNERGFDFFHGFLGDMMDSYHTHLRHGENYMRLNGDAIDPEGHATDLFAKWACDYLDQRKQRPESPFFLYLAFNAPHFPIEPPQDWLQRVLERTPAIDVKRAKNIAFIEHLDDRIGWVLDKLRETGLEQNTLIAFTSDNGGSLPHGQSNHPWRDGKQSHYDGGLRVPFIVRLPNVTTAGSRCEYAGQTFDLFPTAVELAGGTCGENLDAVSLIPLMKGQQIETERDLYFVRREGGVRYGGKSYEAIIRGGWKLMQNDPFSSYELYNLSEDPKEQHNLAAGRPEKVAELAAALRHCIQRGGMVAWQRRTE